VHCGYPTVKTFKRERSYDAARVADRVQRELALPFDMEGQEVFMSASIGIALGGGPGSEQRAEDLLRDADTAMYRAKGQGSGTHAVFDSTMHDRAVAVLQLETDLRRALDRGELRVLYQPVVSLLEQAAHSLLPLKLVADFDAKNHALDAFFAAHAASLEKVEREHIMRVLAQSATLDEAAATLGINVTTLWRKRKRYGTD